MKGRKVLPLLLSLLLTVGAVPACAASELPSRLPFTGMVWWVLPALFFGGILLAVIGWKRHQKGEEDGTDES